MVYAVDTHALIWYLTGDEKIGKNAKRVFVQLENGQGKLIISIIVFLETLILIEKGKIRFSWQDQLRTYALSFERSLLLKLKMRNSYNY